MADLLRGMVIKSTGSWYRVALDEGPVIDCTLRGNLRISGIRSTNPVAVGDRVSVSREAGAPQGQISEVLDRRNYIIRKSSNLSHQVQILAANLDQVVLVITLVMPETKTLFLDRFLATAEAYQIPALLVYNKCDLYEGPLAEMLYEQMAMYRAVGYPCFSVSALSNEGIDELRNELKGRLSLVSGNSGVGKSTLLNALIPGLNLKTATISDFHLKGRHTTTFAEAFAFPGGGYLIDTPGIKGFGTFDMQKNELFHFFREIFALSASCRFYNCTHTHEPGCAVVEALETGQLHPSRYRSYLGMFLEEPGKYRWKES